MLGANSHEHIWGLFSIYIVIFFLGQPGWIVKQFELPAIWWDSGGQPYP